ncbi:hypothetical protein CY652_13605 [Burkholderia sp. WAC0059]|nr:hypothetical protein CY652_13605 [Burkholderia sp. WAC0059]
MLAGGRLRLIPWLAYDFHDWMRNAIERYQHQAAGVGALVQYALTSTVVVEGDLTAERTFDARMKTVDLAPDVLGTRFEGNAGLGLDVAVGRRTHLRLDYRATRFAYGASPPQAGVLGGLAGEWYEPASRTWAQTVSLGFAWSL